MSSGQQATCPQVLFAWNRCLLRSMLERHCCIVRRWEMAGLGVAAGEGRGTRATMAPFDPVAHNAPLVVQRAERTIPTATYSPRREGPPLMSEGYLSIFGRLLWFQRVLIQKWLPGARQLVRARQADRTTRASALVLSRKRHRWFVRGWEALVQDGAL